MAGKTLGGGAFSPAFLRRVAVAIVAAASGACLFTSIGAPAGALLGATVATVIASAIGAKPLVPVPLRNLAFTMIGLTLGAAVTPDFLSDLHRVAGSLAVLTLSMALTVLLAGGLLVRLFGADPATAVLATSPGAMSYALALTTGGIGDPRRVMVLQSLRLVLITVCLPPAIGAAQMGHALAGHGPETLGLGASLLLLLLGVLAAIGFARLRLPAAALLAGLVVSAIAHATGLIAGRPAPELTFAGFATAGAVVGSRFAGISWADLRQLGLASLASTGIGLAVAAAAAFLVATLLDRSFGEVMVAFAPGGVEAMASMALSLGYDPVFVSTHHIFRILILFLLLPLLLRRLGTGRAAG